MIYTFNLKLLRYCPLTIPIKISSYIPYIHTLSTNRYDSFFALLPWHNQSDIILSISLYSLFITLSDHPIGNLPFALSFFVQLPLVRIQYKWHKIMRSGVTWRIITAICNNGIVFCLLCVWCQHWHRRKKRNWICQWYMFCFDQNTCTWLTSLMQCLVYI